MAQLYGKTFAFKEEDERDVVCESNTMKPLATMGMRQG